MSSALSPFGLSGEQCSEFLLSRPPPVFTKVVGCVSSVNCQDWSMLHRECEVVSGHSSPLVCLFVTNACLSCLVLGCSLQLGSRACFQMPLLVLHTITSMASGLHPKPCPSFGSLPKPCSCYLSNPLGFGPCCFFRGCFRLSFTVGEQDKTSTHAFCLPVLFVLR